MGDMIGATHRMSTIEFARSVVLADNLDATDIILPLVPLALRVNVVIYVTDPNDPVS